jgi:hypothetical protein
MAAFCGSSLSTASIDLRRFTDMNNFVRRHFQHCDRISSAAMGFGLAHYILRVFGPTGGFVAASILIMVGAFVRVYLFELTRRASK